MTSTSSIVPFKKDIKEQPQPPYFSRGGGISLHQKISYRKPIGVQLGISYLRKPNLYFSYKPLR